MLGLVRSIRVFLVVALGPREAAVGALGLSGGGVWKTYDFVRSAPNPTWHPAGDTLPNLAVANIALDPSNPDVLFAALGDPYDVHGNEVVRSGDGAGSWSAPVALAGSYPAGAGGLSVAPLGMRDIAVDPTDPKVVLAASDVGLFRSGDGGQSFALVDLPNAGSTQL